MIHLVFVIPAKAGIQSGVVLAAAGFPLSRE